MARIVFDLDGTLIDSALDLQSIANGILAQEGLAPITLEQTHEFVGNGASVFVKMMCKARDLDDGKHETLLARFVTDYVGAVNLTTVYPGVVDTLDTLTAQGHSLGICTNKPIKPCRAVLNHLDLAKYFTVILGGDSLKVRKPNPAPLHAAFSELPEGNEVFVGDSEIDAQTAERASVPFLLYTEGYHKSPIETMSYTRKFSHFEELPTLIAALDEA